MYADFEYYQTEYGGKMSAEDYKRFGRRAERRIDGRTGGKLQFAFPTNERDVEAVKIASANWQTSFGRLTVTTPPQWRAWERWRRLTGR